MKKRAIDTLHDLALLIRDLRPTQAQAEALADAACLGQPPEVRQAFIELCWPQPDKSGEQREAVRRQALRATLPGFRPGKLHEVPCASDDERNILNSAIQYQARERHLRYASKRVDDTLYYALAADYCTAYSELPD